MVEGSSMEGYGLVGFGVSETLKPESKSAMPRTSWVVGSLHHAGTSRKPIIEFSSVSVVAGWYLLVRMSYSYRNRIGSVKPVPPLIGQSGD